MMALFSRDNFSRDILKNKAIKRIVVAAILFIVSVIIFNIIGSLWINVTTCETMLNNELFFEVPSYIEVGNVSYSRQFSSGDLGLTFDYPDFFKLTEENISGGDIQYHVDLADTKNKSVTGFVEVWTLDQPLELFLSDYKLASGMSDFTESRKNINGGWCIQWDYILKLSATGQKIKARQAFIERSDNLYIVSIFAPADRWKNTCCDSTFDTISSSLRLLK